MTFKEISYNFEFVWITEEYNVKCKYLLETAIVNLLKPHIGVDVMQVMKKEKENWLAHLIFMES